MTKHILKYITTVSVLSKHSKSNSKKTESCVNKAKNAGIMSEFYFLRTCFYFDHKRLNLNGLCIM